MTLTSCTDRLAITGDTAVILAKILQKRAPGAAGDKTKSGNVAAIRYFDLATITFYSTPIHYGVYL